MQRRVRVMRFPCLMTLDGDNLGMGIACVDAEVTDEKQPSADPQPAPEQPQTRPKACHIRSRTYWKRDEVSSKRLPSDRTPSQGCRSAAPLQD